MESENQNVEHPNIVIDELKEKLEKQMIIIDELKGESEKQKEFSKNWKTIMQKQFWDNVHENSCKSWRYHSEACSKLIGYNEKEDEICMMNKNFSEQELSRIKEIRDNLIELHEETKELTTLSLMCKHFYSKSSDWHENHIRTLITTHEMIVDLTRRLQNFLHYNQNKKNEIKKEESYKILKMEHPYIWWFLNKLSYGKS